MSEESIDKNSYQGTSSAKMLVAMVGIGVLCALLIVLTYAGTKPRIEMLQANALQEAIFKVIPGITSTQGYVMSSPGKFVKDASAGGPQVFAGYDSEGALKGIAIEASGQGYADIIRILYGYDPYQQKVVGFYVLESKETPGLGDKIEKDAAFLRNFTALDVALNDAGTGLKNEVVTVKKGAKFDAWEIDGITGATISSRAIGDIINKSASELLPEIKKNLDLFEAAE
jgi:electron transport complex protein RnfG